MLRLPPWAAVAVALLGVTAGQARARPPGPPQRMPVGPPEPGSPSSTPPPARPATPGPGPTPAVPEPSPGVLIPDPYGSAPPASDYPGPASVITPYRQGPLPAGKGAAATRGDTKGQPAGAKAPRWKHFHRPPHPPRVDPVPGGANAPPRKLFHRRSGAGGPPGPKDARPRGP